jgi:hypothetical protein
MSAGTSKQFRLSWSKLKELEECRAKGWLHFQGKFSEQRDSRIFFPGTVVDRVMRAWLEADKQVPGAMVGLVDAIFDREEASTHENGDGIVKWKHVKDRDETREKCRECVRRLEPILLERVIPFDYQVAARFTVPVLIPYQGVQRELMLTGEMDLLVRRPEGLVVDDLKMTQNTEYWRQTFPQLTFYGIACAAMRLGWPVGCSLIQPMCPQQVLPFVFTPDNYAEMWSRIVTAAEHWWNGDHSPKADNAGCAYCPAKLSCPKMRVQGSRRILGGVSGS